MSNRHFVQNLDHLLQAGAGVETKLDAAVRQKTLQQLAAGLRRRRTVAPRAEASNAPLDLEPGRPHRKAGPTGQQQWEDRTSQRRR